MNAFLPGAKYSVPAGNGDQTVNRSDLGSSSLRQWNVALPFAFDAMPRCSQYHSQSLSGLSDLKKIPPMPVTRFILREHLRDGGLAMNFCRVEQWNPFVVCVAQNQRQFCSGENHAVDVALCFQTIDNRQQSVARFRQKVSRNKFV